MKTLIILALMSGYCVAKGQDETPGEPKGDFGLGIGIDYGGFGGRVTVCPAPAFGLFGAGGYNLNGFGYNVGGVFRISPGKKKCLPWASCMDTTA